MKSEVSALKIDFRRRGKYLPFFTVVLLIAALMMFWREVRGMTLAGLVQSLDSIPPLSLFCSLAAVVASYWLSSMIEKYAVAESGLHTPYCRTAFISFVSNAIGAGVGAAALSGGSLRYRFYSRCGAKPAQVGRIIAVTQLATWVGAAGLNGLVLLFWPRRIIDQIGFPHGLRWLLAAACLALPVAALLLSHVAHNRGQLVLHGRVVPIPKTKVMLRLLTAGFFSPPATAMVLFSCCPRRAG